MHGVGLPLVTPFEKNGDVDYERLRDLVGWIEDRGVDFLVPCGSNSEAELMTAGERRRVVETVVDEASVPVLAGTGTPGLRETRQATAGAAEAGADAALVVTPFYYNHDQATLAAYYRELADAASIPVYLYFVPVYTDVRLEPDTVGELAEHGNIVGMKDSSGDVDAFVRIKNRVGEEFSLMVGSGGVVAQALSAGASGAVLALANVAPEGASAIFAAHEAGEHGRARERNADLLELNHAVTAEYGIPGLKWAMRERGAPAGHPRSPHREPDADAQEHLAALVDDLG